MTSAALRDVCDAALVVVPAEAAGSESLFQFLRDHADDVLYRCVFMVTKIDLIRREKERLRVLETLTSRIRQQLAIANPRVLACAPQFVVEQLRPARANDPESFTQEEIRGWNEQFVKMEGELDLILRQRRLQAQVDDIAKLAMQLLVHLQTLLQSRLEGYRQRHEALAKVVIPDIDAFIEERAERHTKSCVAQLKKIAERSPAEFHAIASSTLSSMAHAISSADNRKELRSTVESKIPDIYSSTQRQLQKLLKKVVSSMHKAGTGELKEFHADFQKHFRELATLGGKLAVEKVNADAVTRQSLSRATVMNDVIAGKLKEVDQGRLFAQIGGAGGGAIIGTILLPGIGTILGGLAGGLFSLMFGPSLDELKSQCWSQLEPEVNAALESFAKAADEAVNTTAESVLTELDSAIKDYSPRYTDLVQKMKERDAEEKEQLKAFQKNIQIDLERISQRNKKLEQLRMELREL